MIVIIQWFNRILVTITYAQYYYASIIFFVIDSESDC